MKTTQSCRSRSAGTSGSPPPREVVGGRDRDRLAASDAPRHQRGVAQVADPDRDVDAVLEQVHVTFGDIDVDGDIRVAGMEVRQLRHDEHPAKARRQRDAHVTRGGYLAAPDP